MEIMHSKEMELVNPYFRRTIDLREYQLDITNAVQSIVPMAKVTVCRDYYVTDTPILITNDQARRIGRKITSTCSALARLTKHYLYGPNKSKRSGQLFKRK